ncbi:MAG TPA: nuclear transport factor 2 family protein [Vicinamibacterales bacterium]
MPGDALPYANGRRDMTSILRFALFASVVAIGYASVSGPVSAAQQSKAYALLVERMLTAMERDYCQAILTKNPALLDPLLAADFTSVGSDGTVGDKPQMLADVKNSAIDGCTNEDVKVRVYGDAAVVTGRLVLSATKVNPPVRNRQILFTDTFIRRNERWQSVASHATLAAATPKPPAATK